MPCSVMCITQTKGDTMKTVPQPVRAYVYRVATVTGPLLITYGMIDAQKWPLWLAAVGALLVPGLAAVNTPTVPEYVPEHAEDEAAA